jgi:hypothetical protein
VWPPFVGSAGGAYVPLLDLGLPPASTDAALLLTLNPATYTAQVSGAGGPTGIALVEVYEVP